VKLLVLIFFIFSCIKVNLFILLLSSMTKKKNYLYFLINKLNEINLDYVKKTGAILVLRNPEKLNLKDLKKIKEGCRQRRIGLYIANNIKILFLLKTNKFYISAHNKKRFQHLKYINPKIDIIGSAHNASEINEKIKQGCNQIFLSRLFKTKYKFKKGFLGKIKFNLLSRVFYKNFIALGGIKRNNFSHIKDLNVSGVALLSDKKKAGTYVPAFFK
tara:strand:+ start:901 stop:1548 length:648 start_codon:yes stop_codon:yes gene_type:complete